ncbi:MAG: 4Fe-4S binding protein [bacterium]
MIILTVIQIINDKCDFCGTCVAMCPPDAIELAEARIAIIHERCTDCKLCVWICPVETLAFANGQNDTSSKMRFDGFAKTAPTDERPTDFLQESVYM